MDVLTEVSHRLDEVIGTELDRLGRRQPGLSAAELGVIEQTLADLADRLVLDALRTKPALAGRVGPLFTGPLRTAAHRSR